MNERNALAVIDRDYGSMEDFAIAVLSEKAEALDESLPMAKRAEAVGLPIPVFARILASPQFRALLRMDLVNTAFGIDTERRHVEHMAKVASGARRLTMSPSGKMGEVDQTPTDVIAAGKYLNELRGTPVDKGQASAPSLVINIGGIPVGERISVETPTIDVDVEHHRPQRAGGLPPEAVRGRFGPSVQNPALPKSNVDEALGSLYGERAQEQDEDHALAEKQKRGEEPVNGESEQPVPDRRGQWNRRWPGRGLSPQRAFSRSDD